MAAEHRRPVEPDAAPTVAHHTAHHAASAEQPSGPQAEQHPEQHSDQQQPTGGRPAQQQDDAPDPNRWKALVICLLGGGIVLLDVSIVNVALQSISSGLSGATPEAVQWILSGYALAFGLLLVPGGRLGDAVGRRRMFVVGVALFTVASALCGFAPNGFVLVVARLVQGLAGGLLTPQVTALIQQLFRGKERGTAFGLFGATVGIATAIGPLVGGLLITAFGTENGWRFVFFVNLPVGLVTILLAFRYLPTTPKAERGQKHDFDPVGIVLLGAAVVALLLPFVQSEQWKSNAKWWLVVAAVVFAVLFVLWERRYGRDHEPVVDLRLFRRRSFSLGVGLATVYFAGFTPLFFVLTLALQSGLQYSALLAGVASVPFAIGSGIASTVGGRIVHRFGRQLIVVGTVLVLIGLGAVVWVVAEHYGPDLGWWLVLPLLVAGIGSGLTISPNQTLTLSEVPVQQGGSAGGLIQVGARVGSAIGIAAVGSVFYSSLASTKGDYSQGLPLGLGVSLVFVAAALIAGIVDVVVGKVRGTEASV
ncbi:MFS transporter [Curtobacterium sp. ODYSSEY 48 V2]|uniref:MFS transporter n=1 Tax=unclassified Curtobacterium TaxID=257496 RepID=UPI00203D38DB|nr:MULTISPECIES: MFS transporter [unclassified Curtobacterium]MCM3506550.1 MFS transporter [Curtobacterium sp. ODYSSEY 48 V2]MDT0212169.1 MFS transporter [Curtobacterium sp. BRD11]